eukprot:3706107-Lingulodinium_polyedra.AAC.1
MPTVVPPPRRPPPDQAPGPTGPPLPPQAHQEWRARRRERFKNPPCDDGDQARIGGRHCAHAMKVLSRRAAPTRPRLHVSAWR